MKKFLSLFLVLCMMVAMLPVSAGASTRVTVTKAGQIVDSITYKGKTVNAIYAPYYSISNYGSDATYSCAAFAKKFYATVFGTSVYNFLKNKQPIVSSGGGSFSKTASPVIGDAINTYTSGATHWQIVKSVNSDGTVTVIEQNSWPNKSNNIAAYGKKLTFNSNKTQAKIDNEATWANCNIWHYSKNDGKDTPGTSPSPSTPLVTVTTGAATNVTDTTATISASVSGNMKVDALNLHLGTSKDGIPYHSSRSINATSGNATFNLTNLQPNTTYYYNVAASASGSLYWGTIKSFTTKQAGDTVPFDPTPENSFIDVPNGAYFAKAVNWAVDNGITEGTSRTTFSPNRVCTRAQAVTFLWRSAGSPKPSLSSTKFTDVPAGEYYTDAVLWAVENGITGGVSETSFAPGSKCTRAQIVSFMYRMKGSPAVSGVSPFLDVPPTLYYANAVAWAVENGITEGTSATLFSPHNDCSRGQIVTFLYRGR